MHVDPRLLEKAKADGKESLDILIVGRDSVGEKLLAALEALELPIDGLEACGDGSMVACRVRGADLRTLLEYGSVIGAVEDNSKKTLI